MPAWQIVVVPRMLINVHLRELHFWTVRYMIFGRVLSQSFDELLQISLEEVEGFEPPARIDYRDSGFQDRPF